MNHPILIGPNVAAINAYRAGVPGSARWPHMTPRATSGARGYQASEARIVAPTELTPEMIATLHVCMTRNGKR